MYVLHAIFSLSTACGGKTLIGATTSASPVKKMQLSSNFRGSFFFCLVIIATLTHPTSENPDKDIGDVEILSQSRSQAFEPAVEENTFESKSVIHNSSQFINHTMRVLRSAPLMSSSTSRQLDTDNQKFLALVDFILTKTEGRHFYFLYDQLYEDISNQVTRLIQREGDVAVFNCDSDLIELEAVIRGFYHKGHLRNIFVLCSSLNTVNVFKHITAKSLESRSVHWYVIMKENITADIGNVIKEGTQISAAVALGNRFDLVNSFINENDEVAFSEAGWWQWHPPEVLATKGTFTYSMEEPLYRPLLEVYSDFGGRVMKNAVVDNSPFFKVDILSNGTVLPHSGIDFHLLNTLGAKLNFSYELVLAEDGEWGALQPDGKFSGMIGKVEKGLAHFAINEITINAVRDVVIDFTLPYFLESTTLIAPAPHEKNRAFRVLSPFQAEVWLMIAVATLVMGPLIAAVAWFRRTYDHCTSRHHSLSTFSFTAFRSLVVQGNLLRVRCLYQRAIFMLWFVFCYLIYALYAGTLTAVLSVPTFEKPIDSLWDLVNAIEEDNYKPVAAKGTSNEIIFKEATGGIYKQIWELFTFPDGHVPSWDAGVAKVLTGKFVYISAELGGIIRAKRKGLKKYSFSRNTFYPQSYGIACDSGSPYREIFEILLVRMCSAGLIKKWTDDEVAKVKDGDAEESKGASAISLVHLQAAFFLVLLGYCMALVVLIQEYVSSLCHKTSIEHYREKGNHESAINGICSY